MPTPKADRDRFCLSDADVLELADVAVTIEDHYGRPMDIEWAKDGLDGKLYIVQARPETVASQRQADTLETYVLDGAGEVLAKGRRWVAGSPRGGPGSSRTPRTSDSSVPARCWSPTRPRRTGSR